MAVTRLKRKDRRNKARAKNKIKRIKQLTAMPVIKNVDIEEIKAEFAKKAKSGAKKESKAEAKQEEKVKAEAPETEKETSEKE